MTKQVQSSQTPDVVEVKCYVGSTVDVLSLVGKDDYINYIFWRIFYIKKRKIT
jgi:hypothetical protein